MAMSRKDKYNSSGCLDLTAYLALQNIEREENRKAAEKRRAMKTGGRTWETTMQQTSPSVKRTSSC
jgi:hypothetical protein